MWSRLARSEQICSFFRDINAGGFVQLAFHTCGMVCFVVFGLGFGFPSPGTVISLWESLAFSHLSTTTLIFLVIRLSSSASRLVVIHKFCLITVDVDWSNGIVFIVLLSFIPFLRQIEHCMHLVEFLLMKLRLFFVALKGSEHFFCPFLFSVTAIGA